MTEKEEISALVLRIRLYRAEKQTKNKLRQYLYACDVLNMSAGRAMNILSKHPSIKNLNSEECERRLKRLSPIMYKVALIDSIV